MQSTTLALMSARGDLPKVDHAIFADTGWEPKAVYNHLRWLMLEMAQAEIPVHVVSKGNIRDDAVRSRGRGRVDGDGGRWASMPYYVTSAGGGGIVRRQCTAEYKIDPIERFIKTEILGLGVRDRWPREVVCEQWMGISMDERRRMNPPKKRSSSLVRWKTHAFPFIGWALDGEGRMIELPWAIKMHRGDCLKWLRKHYPEREVPRSACIGCPFHSNEEWRTLKERSPEEWQDAVEFDRAIRSGGGMRGQSFLHRSLKPLDEVDLSDPYANQGDLFENECEGMCGV